MKYRGCGRYIYGEFGVFMVFWRYNISEFLFFEMNEISLLGFFMWIYEYLRNCMIDDRGYVCI